MNAFFDMGAVSERLRTRPQQALLELAISSVLGRMEIVSGSAQGVAGPAHDTQRERMMVKAEIAVPVLQQIQAQGDFDGFDVRRQLEEQAEGGFADSLAIKDTEGQRYRIVTMQGGDGGVVPVIEKAFR